MGWFSLVLQGDFTGAADPYNFGIGWGLAHEAPPLIRIISGLGWSLAHEWLPLPTAHRVGNMAWAAILFSLLIFLISHQRNLRIALFAALILFTMPRVFYHAHLGTLDFALAGIWTLGSILFYQQIQLLAQGTNTQFGKIIHRSFVIGTWAALTLLTKINGVLLAPFWLIWLVIYARSWRTILTVALAPLSTALVLYAGFPWLWKAPIAGIQGWIGEFSNRYAIGQWFNGQWVESTPWTLPFVLIGITTPMLVLLLALLGVCSRQSKLALPSSWIGLHTLGLLVVPLYFALPFNDLHDQERMLLPAIFHLAILSAEGLDWIWQQLSNLAQERQYKVPQWAWGLAVMLCLVPNICGIVETHPYELAYYNPLIGGISGAADNEMESIYFASTYEHFLPALNALPPHSKVWVMPNSWGVLYYYQLNGLLRDDLIPLRPSGWGSFYDGHGVPHAIGLLRDADYALIERRQTALNRYTEAGLMQMEWVEQNHALLQLERNGVVLATLHSRENIVALQNR